MDLQLKNKVAIVCGASRGMGYAIARLLAAEGADLALIARDPKKLESVCTQLSKEFKIKADGFPFDLSQVGKIPQLASQIFSRFKTVHILVNNAGGPSPGSFEEVNDLQWNQAIDQNLKSVIAFTKAVVPVMKKHRYGRILNIASQLVKEPSPTMILSNTVRSGVVAFAKTISHELAPFNITVNTLLPGAIFTERIDSLMHDRSQREKTSYEKILQETLASLPMKRFGTPEEFANAAVFLASEKAGFITGTTFAVDGGITKSLL